MVPMHDVAPSAVTIAVAIDAIICTMNFNVSFLLITLIFLLVNILARITRLSFRETLLFFR